MKNISFILLLIIIQKAALAQNTDGLYFENLIGTKWLGERISNENGNFIKDGFSLSILKESTKSIIEANCIWIFDSTKVVVISKIDTLETFNYRIKKGNREVIFNSENDSMAFHYVPTSIGSHIYFSINQDIEITGTAFNTKDGANIRVDGIIYVIMNKEEWKNKWNGKRIKAKIEIIKTQITTPKSLGYDTELYKQGRLGRVFLVKVKGRVQEVLK